MKNEIAPIDTKAVQSRMLVVRNQRVLLDRDVAALYGVQTREINQAVRNNPDKFPAGFIWELTHEETQILKSKDLTLKDNNLRSKILTANISSKSRVAPKVFTERGLYMLATILKGTVATRATLAIVNTYAEVRSMVADMESLQSLKDGSPEQANALSSAGHKLANIIGENLSTESTKTTIELNLAVLKITHEVTRTKKRK